MVNVEDPVFEILDKVSSILKNQMKAGELRLKLSVHYILQQTIRKS
jgi:hypothetical protein